MLRVAVKMLLGDRAKYVGLLFGITFTSFLVTFAGSYFCGFMTRGFALVAENPAADVWVMDPAVVSAEKTANMPASALDRVRGVEGVASAVPLALGTAEVRFPDGRFQPFQVIGVDDATLSSVPALEDGASPAVLRTPDAAIVDPGGTEGKLETPRLEADQWPREPYVDAITRPLAAGDELLVNDHRVKIVGDGSKFKAVNARDKNFTKASIQRRMEQVEASIERYMAALETADRQDGELAPANSVRLKDKIAALKAQMQAFKAMEAEVHAAPDQQISLTDPDARAMGTSGKGTAIVGYNVQTAVDAQHHLIVAHDVTNVGHDRDQLSNMAGQAKAAMGVEALDVLADRGYFKGEEVLACEPLGVTPYVPKPLTSGSKAAGRFGKQDFVYIPEEDAYRCPADQRLTWRFTSAEKGMTLHSYWTSKCAECPLKTQCTTGKERRIKRWEHEAVIDAMQDRLDRAPKSMRVRRATVEHPFGTLKAWMGATHFKTRTLEKVRTEMSLHVLAYNLKRVIAIVGAQPLMAAMRA